jgi:hypothetical protein
MLAGSDLRLSTKFTRQYDWLPGNTAGDSFCTFDTINEDVCHAYLNPDKNDFKNSMIFTVHLMESGRHIDSESMIKFSNINMYYDYSVSN